MGLIDAINVLFNKKMVVNKPLIHNNETSFNYGLQEYKNQITELEYTITELKNKETLNLKQINDLINDKDELKEKVKQQLQELSIKESELYRQRETIHELKQYEEQATQKITNHVIFKELDNIDNNIMHIMLKIKKTYVAKELEEQLNLSKSAIWHHLKSLEKRGYLEIHGEKKSKYFILTDK